MAPRPPRRGEWEIARRRSVQRPPGGLPGRKGLHASRIGGLAVGGLAVGDLAVGDLAVGGLKAYATMVDEGPG